MPAWLWKLQIPYWADSFWFLTQRPSCRRTGWSKLIFLESPCRLSLPLPPCAWVPPLSSTFAPSQLKKAWSTFNTAVTHRTAPEAPLIYINKGRWKVWAELQTCITLPGFYLIINYFRKSSASMPHLDQYKCILNVSNNILQVPSLFLVLQRV